MTSNPVEDSADSLSLGTLLAHCTLVRSLLEASLQDLSWVNRFLTDDRADAGHHAMRNIARERAGFIEARLNGACRVLGVASGALEGEIDAAPFHDRLEHGLAQSQRDGRPLAVMFIDLDGFKEVIERYGRDMGETVLQALAARLQEHTRSEDTASRYGGDELLYLLTDPGDHQSMVAIAERMIRLVREPCHVSLNGTAVSISLGANIGISISPKDGVTVDKLVKSADSAMYRAKQQKSGYSFAH